jgi:hypothetical protein
VNRVKKYNASWHVVLLALLFLQLPGKTQDNHSLRLFLDVPLDTFVTRIDSLTHAITLPNYFIIPRSEKIYRNRFPMLGGINYRFYPKEGKVEFITPLTPGDSLTVIYRKYPFPLIQEYFRRELLQIQITDSSGGRDSSTSVILQNNVLDEIGSFGSNLQRSGSIVRGFEIGNNRDLTLNSGLNLQLSGYVVPDVELIAALTDESTPLQPEGNTQTLNEVDKVFVKIKSPHLGGTLGDYNLTYQNSYFGNLRRKLQGISTNSQFGNFQQQLTYATSRGTFFNNRFLGQEGNQGPYQLVGKNGEREIIVLAGTEKVYVNGTLLIRGENNDYIIDYSLGQVTFTKNRLITSEDRIEIDFEFANNFQRYGKNLLGFSSSKLENRSGFSYDFRFFREWDDTKNLLEDSAPLSDEEKIALAAAGDDQILAAINGATYLGEGQGNYVLGDTLISGENETFFRYVGTGKGDYSVRFTSVGPGEGSYQRERLGIYRFVGKGRGVYSPIKLVPLASDKRLGDIGFSYRFGENFFIQGEAAISQFDQNVFSRQDDGDNTGKAFMFRTSYQNETFRLFKKSFGKLQWSFNWNQRENHFSPLDRPFQPEYNYKWNLSSGAAINQESRYETFLAYQPAPYLQINLDGGKIEKGENTSSSRGKAQLLLTDSTRIKGELYAEKVFSATPLASSDWIRSGGSVGKNIYKIFPYINFKMEERKVESNNGRLTGFGFDEGLAGLKIFGLLGINWNLQSILRDDYLYDPNIWGKKLKLSRSLTNRINGQILQSVKWQGRLSFVFREKKYDSFFRRMPSDSLLKFQPDPQFQDTSMFNQQSRLANLEIQYRNKDRTIDSQWNYKVASELQATQEKIFLQVEQNHGNYIFDEELQEYVPDPSGDYLLLILPTGQFESVTNIEVGWQVRYRPKISPQNYSGIEKVLKNISTFTYIRLDEKSREKNIWQLYLLNFKNFHDMATTVRGAFLINQDVYFFERNPDFGITIRSRYRDNLYNQYVDAQFNESRKLWDRSVIWRQKLWKKILSHELEYGQSSNHRQVKAAPSRNRDIFGQLLNIKLNYRPVYSWQFRFEFEGGVQKDHAELNQLQVGYLEISPRVNYAIQGKARATASIDFLTVNIMKNPFNQPVPFEVGKGKKEGNSLNWNLRFEYFISGNVTITMNYNGRKDAGMNSPIHLGQAEVRAFF